MQFIQHTEGNMDGGLSLQSCDTPVPSSSQVLVKVSAFAVNRADLLQRAGHYPPPKGESPILGLEVCGEIESVGSDVTDWQAGQRVCAIVSGGGYAEYVAIEASHLMAVPASLSDAEGAGLSEVYLTAYQALRWVGELQNGQKALIHAGASGVGLAALQLCKLWDIATATTASSEAKLAACQQAGANILVNYKEADFVPVVKEQWPGGVNMVLDMVGGDYLNRNLKVLAMDGTVVYLAMMAGRFADKLDMALMLGKRASVKGTTLRNRDVDYKARLVAEFSKECLPAFATGELKVPLDTVYSISEVEQAHQQVLNNNTQGKVVIAW